jgi:hypothetical protein
MMGRPLFEHLLPAADRGVLQFGRYACKYTLFTRGSYYCSGTAIFIQLMVMLMRAPAQRLHFQCYAAHRKVHSITQQGLMQNQKASLWVLSDGQQNGCAPWQMHSAEADDSTA